jgi:hypothetical protein
LIFSSAHLKSPPWPSARRIEIIIQETLDVLAGLIGVEIPAQAGHVDVGHGALAGGVFLDEYGIAVGVKFVAEDKVEFGRIEVPLVESAALAVGLRKRSRSGAGRGLIPTCRPA